MNKSTMLLLGAALLLCVLVLTRRQPLPPTLSPSATPPQAAQTIPTTKTAPAALTQITSANASAAAVSPSQGTAADTNDVLAAFREWTTAYLQADVATRAALVPQGVEIAKARRPVFKQLIQDDPRAAVEQMVSMRVRQQLPAEVLALIEERVSGRAALRVYQGVGLDNRSPARTHRIAEFANGKTYVANVYGRREESVRWLAGARLNGPAIDNQFAVSSDPICAVEPGYVPPPEQNVVTTCPVSGEQAIPEEEASGPVSEGAAAIEVGGELVYLCDGSHTVVYKEQLIYAEGGTGAPQAFTGILPAAPTPSIGNVKVLVIPVTFADQNDVPSSETVLHQLMRNVGEHYANASYGKLTLLTTVVPPIILPHNEAWYIQKDSSNGGPIDGLGMEHSHARAEARKMGFDDDEYDCVVVRLRGGPRATGGWGGGRSVWIYGDGVDVTAHEIGHVFGLGHANLWDTGGTSAIGAGANSEYDGYFDVMGGIGLPYGHYNAAGKNQIRWLPDAFVSEVTASGTYRTYAQDQPILDPAKRFALKVRKDSLRTYWGELRGLYTGHSTRTWADFGLILGWRYPSGGGGNIQLIDTTPGTSFGRDDSPISRGRTFSDYDAGIHITTLGVNPATVEEPKSIDVVVNLGAFPGNQSPTQTLTASAYVVPLNTPVTFTSAASDPDGDPLAYSWQHFGDTSYRTISPNAPVMTRSFTVNGTYVVSCTVSDMKGGTSTRNVLVTAGTGGGRFTIKGRITLNGHGLANVLVKANNANGVVTDDDGFYTIPNLTAATYQMTPLLYGYTFSELFNNSVAVGPNFEDADFEASLTAGVSITASTPACNEAVPGTPAKFTLTRTGNASQPLVVNVATPTGSATVTTDYTMSPAMGSGSQGFSTFTIPAGADSLDVSVTPVNDTAAEGPETVTLTLGAGAGYLIQGLGRATVVINDNDTTLPKLSLAVGEEKTTEGSATPATITFTRTGASNAPLALTYSVSGTATNGSDCVMLNGAITIPAGSVSTSLSVTSINDSASESLETVIVRFGSSASYLADPLANNATIAIVDDDVQVITVTASDVTASERDLSVAETIADTATFLITRSGDISEPLTVYYAVAGTNSGTTAPALHGVDYELLPGVLTIPAGQAQGTVTIIPRYDGLGEGQESVTLQLGAGPTNYRLGIPAIANVTINDAGDPAYVEVLAVENATEGSATLGRFRFSLKGSMSSNIVVSYTVTGTATSEVDFTALSGSVSIPGNGVNTTEITVTPVNDVLPEDLETVTVTINPGVNYGVLPQTGTATIWLFDNEQPTLFVDAHTTNSSTYPPAMNEAGPPQGFYISRRGSTASALTVNYTLSGTATSGSDYVAVSGAATIPAGASGVDVILSPINDSAAEGTETVVLSLAPGTYSRGPAATLYLMDNETPAIALDFAANGSTALESAGTANIPVTLSASPSATTTVEYVVDVATRQSASVNGTAVSPLPYWVRVDRLGDTLIGSISPDGTNWSGVSTQVFSMVTASYLAGLYVCSFNASLNSTSVFDNVTITNLQAGGTIGTRSGGMIGGTVLAGSATVVGGTYTVAGAGDNVEGTTDQGYFTWWPINNSTSVTIIARVVSQQNTANGATAGVMVRESTANTSRRAYMAATPGAGFEFHYRSASSGQDAKLTQFGAQPVWVQLQRSGNLIRAFQSIDGAAWTQIGADQDLPFGPEVIAGLAVSAQSAGGFAEAMIDNVSITPGTLPALGGRTVGFSSIQGTHTESAGVYTISSSGEGVNGSNDDCYFLSGFVTGDFTLTARITGMQTTNSSPQAGVMIRENTRRPARMAFVGSVPGGRPQLVYRNSTLTIANGINVDHNLPPGVLTFAPGVTTQNIPVTLINDTIPEQDEVVMVILRNANGARLGTRTQHAFVIVDDDAAPALPFVSFASAASSASEGTGTAQIPVSLSIAAETVASVDYQVSAGSASAGDFVAATGTLNFAPGDTARSIPVSVTGDTLPEGSETVLLTLSNPVGLRFATITNHSLTILDDDTPVITISSTDTNANESGDTAFVTLTRSGSTSGSLTVNLSRTGTAGPTIDYTGIGATAVFDVGQATTTLTLAPVQDTGVEGAETVITTIAAGSGYAVGSPSSVTLFIADDDLNVVSIVAGGATAKEGGTNGSFTITRAGSTASALTVNLTVSGTATSGADYTNSPTPLTSIGFAAGQSTRTITIHPLDDLTTEGDEMVLLQITSGAGSYEIDGIGYASVTITDNDIPPTVFISSPTVQGVVVASSNGVEFVATANDEDAFPQPLAYAWMQVAGPGSIAFGAISNAATPATFSAPGTYIVRVTVTDGRFTANDQITINIGRTNTLVANDWIAEDIGPPTVRGFAGVSGSNWIISAAGGGYTSNSDRAHAVARQVSGDGTIVARVTGINGPAASEAGVTIRDAMHRYARRAALIYQSSARTLRFRPRLVSNANDFSISVANLDLPLWLKLERNSAAGTVAAFYATNNAGAPGPWIQVSTNVNIAMDALSDYGFTADSGSDTVASTATFDNISLTPAPSGPAVVYEDFGGNNQAGTYAYDSPSDTHTMSGQGSIDGSGMTWMQQFTGDFELTVLQLSASSSALSARSGLMIRDSFDDGPMAFFGRCPQGAFGAFVWRTNPKGGTANLTGPTQTTRWFRMIRRGNTITALHAPNNAGNTPGAWVQIGLPQTVFLQPTIMAGLYVDNSGGVGLNTATFTKFSIVPLNIAPIVNAGADVTNASSPLALEARVRDDGLPAPFTTEWTVAAAPGAATFANSNALATTVTFSNAGVYTLRVWASDGMARTFDDLNFTFSTSTPFQSWQAANFVGGSTNVNAAPGADPDNDGLNNAGEYTFGTNPNVANAHPVIASIMTNGPNQFLRVTMPKNPAATDAAIEVQGGDDVTPPNWSGAGLVTEINTTTQLQVRDGVPVSSAARRFLRVRVTLN